MIKLLLVLAILCSNKISDCKELLISNLKKSITEIIGKTALQECLSNSKNVLSYKLELDSTSKVTNVYLLKNNCLSDSVVNKIAKNLKDKKYCLYNSDPHLNFNEYIQFGRNKYYFIVSLKNIQDKKKEK
jgi:hypothetical protein